ncbi:hypothetical protein AGDE_12809 [Angomonas deanei]|uniref:Endonuclease/Exonuclease/phosphatase family n=1 Tax=Angomonas deanei TaxID=59799 RepID=A0A7G2CGT9_9TRYP|nr:hypothetical protein AGDE_12809 [Angomonas deanei]CAD2218966.1 hypothetical protein, conserved [Angomonas deanei]|eukprot:EPY23442.1 hypothetical protein AGDE_12809 [Angomonas deanei]
MDGTAIYYNKNRFTLLEKVAVRFNALAQADNGLTAYERKKLQVDSHNVALIVVLRDHLLPSQVYIVGGVHLIWQRVEAQLWQSNRLMNVVEQLKAKYQGGGGSVRSPIVAETPKGSQSGTRSSIDFSTQYTVTCILGGDFNIERTNPTFSYLRNGVVPPDTPVFKYWKAELEGESGSPTLLPPPERRITSQFPSPPTGDRSPHACAAARPARRRYPRGT